MNYIRKPEVEFVSHGLQAPPQQPLIVLPLNKVIEDSKQLNNENDAYMSMEQDSNSMDSTKKDKHPWMSKLQGVKKISNKERRRRQNQNLRRLLTPKSALMVLNEIVPGEHFEFKVQEVPPGQYYKTVQSFLAELVLNGQTYTAVGETKAAARHAVAEQAIRDLIIKKMEKVQEKMDTSSIGEEKTESGDEDSMPMMQLASFALHKLFSEWEGKGVRVPQFKPPSAPSAPAPAAPAKADGPAAEVSAGGPRAGAGPGAAGKKKERALPAGAAAMHPCMLLTYMRPQQEYRELARLGDRPHDHLFKVAVLVDGQQFVGQGGNKKEARRQAATAACKELFGITFDTVLK